MTILPRSRRVSLPIPGRHCGATYRVRMETKEATCVLCGDPIDPDQATMIAAGTTAHAGCAYRDSAGSELGRWMPPELAI